MPTKTTTKKKNVNVKQLDDALPDTPITMKTVYDAVVNIHGRLNRMEFEMAAVRALLKPPDPEPNADQSHLVDMLNREIDGFINMPGGTHWFMERIPNEITSKNPRFCDSIVEYVEGLEKAAKAPEPKEPEPWVPKAGDYVKAKVGEEAVYRIERINGPDSWALWYDGTLYPNNRRVQQYRPATQAEIDAHLEAEAIKKQEVEWAAITELQEGDACEVTPKQYDELRALMEPLYACYVGGNSSDEWVEWDPRNKHAPLQRWTRKPHGELRPVVIPFHEFLRRAKATAARLEAEATPC